MGPAPNPPRPMTQATGTCILGWPGTWMQDRGEVHPCRVTHPSAGLGHRWHHPVPPPLHGVCIANNPCPSTAPRPQPKGGRVGTGRVGKIQVPGRAGGLKPVWEAGWPMTQHTLCGPTELHLYITNSNIKGIKNFKMALSPSR